MLSHFTLLTATTLPPATPPPLGWRIFDPSQYFGKENLDIKTVKMISPETYWIVTKNNDLFVFNNNRLTPVPGLKVASIAASKHGVWAQDTSGQVHLRQGITPQRPQGHSWAFTNLNGGDDYEKITEGPYGVVLGKIINSTLSHKESLLFF